MKKVLAITLLILVLINVTIIPASANSAQTKWEGIDSAGSIFFGDDCPIEVTKEVLTFNIERTPIPGWPYDEEFDVSKSTVTAEYTFYNPSDLDITASLAFPFGILPHYTIETMSFDITLNGEAIDKAIRYTYPSGSYFDLEKDIARLSNEYLVHEFFTPEMTVTKYTYNFESDVSKNRPYVGFTVGDNESSRIYFPSATTRKTLDNGDVVVGDHFFRGTRDVYVIGEPLAEPLEWEFYTDYTLTEYADTPDTTSVELIRTTTDTFEHFALDYRQPHSKVSDVDWYNAIIYALEYNGDNSLLASRDLKIENKLMNWYQYEIAIGAGESVVNTVTAPMYPTVSTSKSPAFFQYTYFLSPASTWASFGELEININTPYYVVDTNIEGFIRTDSGYTLKLDGLPDTEFEFMLRSKPDKIMEFKSSIPLLAKIPVIYFYAVPAVAAAIALVAIVILIKKRR